MDFKSAFKNVLDKFTNGYIQGSTAYGNNFLRYGNRSRMDADWSLPQMADEDLYRGYSFAVIQKRANKVASLAKTNLKTWAKPEIVDAFQDKEEEVYHPYLSLIEDSTRFSEKQFWKNISIYLDLAGRYYLGAVRTPMGTSGKMSDIKEFIMLNPYEIKRVINNRGELAGYIENKSDGRYREWPVEMIIEMRELNPFDPENSQWSMAEAAKDAVFTLQEGGNYTRQSLHGNIDAPGIITTDVILDDEQFANFRERVREHRKGEPLFGNGAGAIKWESMQIDLDKAALLDISNMNREELFAVSGTSKTTLGIEQSGTTRETARVQNENFIADTAQPRLEDIIDFLNLDYKKYYKDDYEKSGFYIEVKSAIGTDFIVENEATTVRKSQADLALQLIQAKYTPESAYQYAQGNIELSDLELQQGVETPQVDMGGDTGDTPSGPDDTPSGNPTPEEENTIVNNEAIPDEQGWVGAKTEPIDIQSRLTEGLKSQLYTGDLQKEITNIPAEENPHFTVVYGLTAEGMNTDLDALCKQYIPETVKISDLDTFEKDDYNIIVAKLQKTKELEKMHQAFLEKDHYPQEFDEYTPHITLCCVNKNTDVEDFYNVFNNLKGLELKVIGYDIDNPWAVENSAETITGNVVPVDNESEEVDCPSCSQKKIGDFINEIGGEEGDALENAYNTLLGEIIGVQHDAINQAIENVTVNSFTKDDISTPDEQESLFNRLKVAFKNYWWFIIPLLGKRMMSLRNKEYDKDYKFVFNKALKNKIDEQVSEVAQGHLDTILNDILSASNKAFTDVVEKAAAGLITTAYREDPSRFAEYFTSEPTRDEAISAIHNTDILEKNRKLYDKAYKLAQDGYNRAEIINSIRNEFDYLSTTRANTIAGNETSRAFTQSQYEADYQFLTKTGQLTTAYKQLYSRTGDPCVYCQTLIDKGPIPFTQNFLNKGDAISVEENGRVRTFTADYEAIQSGCVHTNCHCSYRLILNYSPKNSAKKGSGWWADNPNNPHIPKKQDIASPYSDATEAFNKDYKQVASDIKNDFDFDITKLTFGRVSGNVGGDFEKPNTINFNNDFITGGDALKVHQQSDRFANNTLEGAIRHECAHAVSYNTASKVYKHPVPNDEEATMIKIALAEVAPKLFLKIQSGKTISKYARDYFNGKKGKSEADTIKKDRNRYILETFAELYSNKKSAPLAKAIITRSKKLSPNYIKEKSKEYANLKKFEKGIESNG